MSATIRTLWKDWEGEGVEMIFALDDVVIEGGGWETWQEGVNRACAAFGITEGDTRVVLVEVPTDAIRAAFEAVAVQGTVVEENAE